MQDLPPPGQPHFVPPHPDDDDDDEDEDTFKLSFQNIRKRKAFVESFYCSGIKKRHIVHYVNEPEITPASANVSMTSLTGGDQPMSGSQVSMVSMGLATGSRSNLMPTPNVQQQVLGSHQSLTSSNVSLDVGGQQQQMVSFTPVGGIRKQVPQTITMPGGGAFMTEKDITRASIKPLQVGTTQHQQVTTPGAPVPSIASLQVQPFQLQPVALPPGVTTVPRKIVKTDQPERKAQQTDPDVTSTVTGTMGEDILKGAYAVAGETPAGQTTQQLTPTDTLSPNTR